MLELRPSCEHCNKALPPASPEARICSFECTFCASCVQDVLGNVCPNCGGGFVVRPVRPARLWKDSNPLGKHPASTQVKHKPVDVAAHAARVAAHEETHGRSEVSSSPSVGLTRSGRSGGAIKAAPFEPAGPPGHATTALSPMREQAYAAYVESSVAGYADDNVTSGRWPKEGAVERSRAEFVALLPQGLATPGHHLYEIKAAPGGPTVGVIWFAEETRHGLRGAHVYDVEVQPDHRRQGHARRAFLALEPLVAALGLPTIGLHVFGHNAGAQALYRQLGYALTGTNMQKRLSGPA